MACRHPGFGWKQTKTNFAETKKKLQDKKKFRHAWCGVAACHGFESPTQVSKGHQNMIYFFLFLFSNFEFQLNILVALDFGPTGPLFGVRTSCPELMSKLEGCTYKQTSEKNQRLAMYFIKGMNCHSSADLHA